MAITEPVTTEELRRELDRERHQLARAVEALRENADPTTHLGERLPLLLAAAFAVTFVAAGGIGATMRLFARRSREGHKSLRIGRFLLIDSR
jgi:hypothetical protein